MSWHRRAARDDLAELTARLAGGIGPAIQRSRPASSQLGNSQALARWPPAGSFSVLARLRENSWNEQANLVQTVINDLEQDLRADRALLLAVLSAPDNVLSRVSSVTPGGPVEAWMALCWIAQAVSEVVSGRLPVPVFALGDADLLLPLAARLQFLAMSEPMRWRAELSRAWWASEPDQAMGGSELVRRVLGAGTWLEFVGRCRLARYAWLQFLDAYQSHPYLAQADPREFEEELAAVVYRHQPAGSARGRPYRWARFPLVLSGDPLPAAAAATPEDAAVITAAAERHLLPRFDLAAAITLASYAPSRWGMAWRIAGTAAAAAAAIASVTYAALLHVQLAAVLAASCYGLIGAGVVAFDAPWSWQWLLRLPAASAVGLFALVSLLPGGWLETRSPGWVSYGWAALAVLAGAASGYLIIEARNHGVGRWQAVSRSAAVAAIGTVHAFMVSVVGLVWVAPAFIGKGSNLAALWRSPGYAHAGRLLLLAAAWCLAIGVFSQILWDDRPITMPLSHLQWRSGE